MTVTLTGVVILLIIAGFVIYGVKVGLMQSVFSLISVFFTTVFTWLIYPWVAGLLMKTPLYQGLHDWIYRTLSTNQQLAEGMPDFIGKLPPFLQDTIQKAVLSSADSFLAYCTQALAVLAVNVVSILVLFVGIRLMMTLLKRFGKAINKMKLIGPVNALLGGVFGLVQGVVIVYLVVMIISYLPTTAVYERVREDLTVSPVGNILYQEDRSIFGLKPRFPQ